MHIYYMYTYILKLYNYLLMATYYIWLHRCVHACPHTLLYSENSSSIIASYCILYYAPINVKPHSPHTDIGGDLHNL